MSEKRENCACKKNGWRVKRTEEIQGEYNTAENSFTVVKGLNLTTKGVIMIKKFSDWLKAQGWNVTLNTASSLELNKNFVSRYPYLGDEYEEFLRHFKEVISGDEKTWFLCGDEYNGLSESAFKWNEFEELSLEAAEDDTEWREEIKKWWDKKLPIIMSVRAGYSFFAIDLENNCGNVVRGEEPEFEETEIIASSFYEFLDMLMKGMIVV